MEYSCVFPAFVVADVVAEDDGVVKADATDATLLRTAARAAAVVEGIVPFLIFFDISIRGYEKENLLCSSVIMIVESPLD